MTWQEVQQDFQESLKHAGDSISDSRISLFSKSRLIAEVSGIKGKSVVIAGVEVAIDEGWILNTPVIQTEVTGGYRATVLPQFQNGVDETENWANRYQKHVIFPILLEGEPNEDVSLKVFADFSACSDEGQKCLTSHEKYQLTLPISHSYPTRVAAPLQRALISAAVDVDRTRLKLENSQVDNRRLKIRILFPNKVKFVDVQSITHPFEVVHKNLNGKEFSEVLSFQNDIQSGENIPVNIRTDQGNYTATIKVSDTVMKPIPTGVSLWIAFWTGLFFLITSSVWPLLMSPHQIISGHFEKEVRRLQAGIILAMGWVGAFWLCGFAPSLWIQNAVVLGMILTILIYLTIKPIQPIWVVAVCLVILPKPFWYMVDSVSVGGKIGLLTWWSCCLLLPFNLWILCKRPIISFFWQAEEESGVAYRIFVRLSYLILLVWLGVGAVNPMMKNDDISDLEKIQTPAIIQVAPRVCFKCAVNRWRLFPFLPYPVYQLNNRSELAKRWVSDSDESVLILMTPSHKEVILPDHLTLNQLKQAIRQEL